MIFTSLKNDICEAINEELSIADDVRNEALKISDDIAKKRGEFEEIDSEIPDSKKFCCSKTIEVFGVKVSTAFIYYNFLTPDALKYASGKYDFTTSFSSKVGRNVWIMTIKCYGISGGLKFEDLCDSVQHELEHIYQGEMGQSAITSQNVDYSKISTKLGSKDERIRRTAEILYASIDYEQDAMLNGLYASLNARGLPAPLWQDIEDSEIYSWLERLVGDADYVKNIKDDENYYQLCKTEFNIKPIEVLARAKHAEKRIKSKIGKVLIKIRKDKINEGHAFMLTSKGTPHPFFYEIDPRLFVE